MKKQRFAFLILSLVLCLVSCARVPASKMPMELRVPILLYHHITDDVPESGVTLNPETFRRQMQLIKANGYTAISFEELIAYVNGEKSIPKKSVIITFDDGYYSNYEIAYPILRELNMKATVFVIGVSVGADEYKDTGVQIIPHFDSAEIREMVESGVISIQSHSYDMHQNSDLEKTERTRDAVYKFYNETDEEFALAIENDAKKQEMLFSSLGLPVPRVFAYPKGISSSESDDTLKNCGYVVTLTTMASNTNIVRLRDSNSLIGLGRYNIDQTVSDADLLAYLGFGE